MHSSVRTAILMCVDIFMSVLAHVNLKLLVVHMYKFGKEAWSAHGYTDVKTMLLNLPVNLSVTTNEVHPHPWSLFISMLCTLPWYRSAFVSLSEHYIWVLEAICIASWGLWRTKEAFPGGMGTVMRLPLTMSLRPMGTGWVPTTYQLIQATGVVGNQRTCIFYIWL